MSTKSNTGCPAAREMSGKFRNRHKSGKSQGILIEVKERYDFEKSQGFFFFIRQYSWSKTEIKSGNRLHYKCIQFWKSSWYTIPGSFKEFALICFIFCHYSDVIMSAMASQVTMFTQPFMQVLIKENINAPRHWPLWGELIPRTKGQ